MPSYLGCIPASLYSTPKGTLVCCSRTGQGVLQEYICFKRTASRTYIQTRAEKFFSANQKRLNRKCLTYQKKIKIKSVLCVCPQLLSHVRFVVTPWTVAHQALLSAGILQARILEQGCHALLQGIVSTQGSNQGLLHCRLIRYHLSHQSTYTMYSLAIPLPKGLPIVERGFVFSFC